MSDDETCPSSSAPAPKVYETPHIGGYMDLKYRVLAETAKAAKQSSSQSFGFPQKNSKKSIFGLTKEEKARQVAAEDARKQRIYKAEKAVELDEKERQRQLRMFEKAAAYDRLKKGNIPQYADGSNAEYLVDFSRRSRSRSPIQERQPSSSQASSSTQWPVSNGDPTRNHDDYDRTESSDAVYYDPSEDSGRLLGAGFYHLPKEVDARVQKIRELEETSRKTMEIRSKRKAERKEKKRKDLLSINIMRELDGLDPILPSSDEDEIDAHPGANLDVNTIPMPDEMFQDDERRINEQKKREANLEWDKEKARDLKWLQNERDYRDDEFRPPDSYFTDPPPKRRRY